MIFLKTNSSFAVPSSLVRVERGRVSTRRGKVKERERRKNQRCCDGRGDLMVWESLDCPLFVQDGFIWVASDLLVLVKWLVDLSLVGSSLLAERASDVPTM